MELEAESAQRVVQHHVGAAVAVEIAGGRVPAGRPLALRHRHAAGRERRGPPRAGVRAVAKEVLAAIALEVGRLQGQTGRPRVGLRGEAAAAVARRDARGAGLRVVEDRIAATRVIQPGGRHGPSNAPLGVDDDEVVPGAERQEPAAGLRVVAGEIGEAVAVVVAGVEPDAGGPRAARFGHVAALAVRGHRDRAGARVIQQAIVEALAGEVGEEQLLIGHARAAGADDEAARTHIQRLGPLARRGAVEDEVGRRIGVQTRGRDLQAGAQRSRHRAEAGVAERHGPRASLGVVEEEIVAAVAGEVGQSDNRRNRFVARSLGFCSTLRLGAFAFGACLQCGHGGRHSRRRSL